MTKNTSASSLSCLSVIMPVYNEVYTLDKVIKRVLNVRLPMELIIVDDCSTDGTRDIIKRIESSPELALQGRADARIKVFYHDVNRGKGAAIRTGISHATGDITVIQDADMEYDPAEYSKLIEPILSGDADVVYGSRFLGERRRVLFFWHMIGNKILTLLSNICTNLNLSDVETCYKVFKTSIIQTIPLRSNRFGFEIEITAKIAKLRCAIYELPISYRGRSYAEGKKIGWKDGFAAIYTILKFWIVEDLFTEDSGHRTLRIMEGAGKYNAWLFDQCKPYLRARVLEVGAGLGNITKFLLDRECVVATDLNNSYLEELKRKFTHYDNVHIDRFDLLDSAGARRLRDQFQPDTLLSLNVIEHIKDDVTAVKNIGEVLGKTGRVVLVLPAHQFLYSKMDIKLGHYRRYNRQSLEDILTKAGFEIEEIRYLNMLGALGWLVNGRLLQRAILPSRQLRVFDWLTKSLFLEKFFHPPFGLSVFVVARKGADS